MDLLKHQIYSFFKYKRFKHEISCLSWKGLTRHMNNMSQSKTRFYFRKFCGLPDAHSFDELFGSMSNETIRRYASIYE